MLTFKDEELATKVLILVHAKKLKVNKVYKKRELCHETGAYRGDANLICDINVEQSQKVFVAKFLHKSN